MAAAPIDEGFPMRKRTVDSKPTPPAWAVDVDEDDWSWIGRAYVDVSPFGRIEVYQGAEEAEEEGSWELYEPAADVTESGVGDQWRPAEWCTTDLSERVPPT